MNRRGFTLIELMLVIMILGLVTAIAYPQYQVLSHANLRESSRQLAGTIRYIYARAILDKKSWRLAIDFENNKYWGERLEELAEIEVDEEDEEDKKELADDSWVKLETIDDTEYRLDAHEEDEEETAKYVKTTTRVLKVTRLPEGVIFRDMRALGRDEVTDNTEYIYFNPYGGVERAVIHLKHANHDWVYTLVTKPLSGRVAIFDEDKDIELVPILGPVRE